MSACERPADLLPDPSQLREDLVEPVSRSQRAQVRVESGHEARRHPVLGGAHRDSGSERGDRLVADVLVDQLGGPPDRVDVDARVQAQPGQRRRHRLARDPVHHERDRVDSAGDQICAAAGGLERGRHRVPSGALAVEAHRQPAGLGKRR
jgi:hypothetical protein